MTESSQIEKKHGPFATLIGRLGIVRQKPPETRRETRMATPGELEDLAKVMKQAEIEAEVKSLKDRLKEVLDSTKKYDRETRSARKLTENGDGTYGLFTANDPSGNYLRMYILNTPTDYVAYYQFRKMEKNINVSFDETTREPSKIEIYDVKEMQKNNAHESDHFRYRKTITFPSKLDDEGIEVFGEIKSVLQPFLDSYEKPGIKPTSA